MIDENLIEKTIEDWRQSGVNVERFNLSFRDGLRAAFVEVRREALLAAAKHMCRLCADGDEPKRGTHDTVVGRVECIVWPLRALLPPAAEEKSNG